MQCKQLNFRVVDFGKKIDILLTSFRRERQKGGTTSGMGMMWYIIRDGLLLNQCNF